jgi:TetR/AcrR family transcriptional regulator, regulator of cefoperazone and chloramphenicol sensitivity
MQSVQAQAVEPGATAEASGADTDESGAGPVKAKRGRRKPNGDSASRQRVIDAAIACILEQGLYRASSNAIAEQAGLSWGVIQYYFGTRETLMLAVLEEGARRLAETVRDAEITSGTTLERVESFMEILARYYGSPDYLVYTQLSINLSHDPRTSEQAALTLTRINDTVEPPLRRLLAEVLRGTGIRRPAVRSTIFHSLRGLAVSQVMLGTVPSIDMRETARQFPAQRKLLAQALALLIEQESKRSPG